jgi:hypothetical protein
MEGRYFHQLILEPEKAKNTPFVDVSTRTTKEYKAFCETNNLPFCMLKKEMDDTDDTEIKGRNTLPLLLSPYSLLFLCHHEIKERTR